MNAVESGWDLLRRAAREQWRGLGLGMLFALCWTAGRVTVPQFVRLGIDRGLEGDDPLWRWPVFVLIAGSVSAAFLGLRRLTAFHNARRIEARYRDRLFAHAQRLHISYHDVTATGDLMSRANTDLQQFQNVFTMVPITAGNFLVVLAAVVIMVLIDPVLAVLALAGLPFVNVLGKRFSSLLHPALAGVQRELAEVSAVVEESVAGIRVVKGFGAEDVQTAKLAVEADDVYGESIRAANVRARYLPAIELLPNLGLVMVLAYGGNLVINGDLTIGELVGFNLYVLMLVHPLRSLGSVVAMAQRASAAGDRIGEVLGTAPRIVDPAKPTRLPDTGQGAAVRFEGVRFGYERLDDEEPIPVLDGLDLDIAPGETVAFVGETGSGKSTVARLLVRFYDTEHGSIRLDDVDVRDVRLGELRRTVALVFEDTFLFSGSIRDNIAFADPDADMASVQRAAELAGIDEFIDTLADGYETVLGERGLGLSGGQRQRIAIARSILADPRVLVLDDATSAVDPSKEHEIRAAMEQVMTGRTTIVIAHRPATIQLADRVVLLDGGRIVGDGSHEELLATNERYRAVLAAGDPLELGNASTTGAH